MSIASVKYDLLQSLKDKEFRDAFKLENVYTSVCFQIRAIREQQELSQKLLGRTAKMAQERISILEDPNAGTKPTLMTLLRIADALDVGLEVRFVPFSKVLDRSVRTDMRELQVDKFANELPLLERDIAFEKKSEEYFGERQQQFHAMEPPSPSLVKHLPTPAKNGINQEPEIDTALEIETSQRGQRGVITDWDAANQALKSAS